MRGFHNSLRRLIAARKAIGELPAISEYTATGNPATFTTNLARALTEFEIPLLPVQTGSGDPSPSNIRPISGWSGVTVTANGQTILVAWESVAGVVYGGKLDAVTGVLTVDMNIVDLGSLEWVNDSFGRESLFFAAVPGLKKAVSAAGTGIGFCDCYKIVSKSYDNMANNEMIVGSWKIGANTPSAGIKNTDYTEPEALAETLNGHYLVFELNEPQTIQLTPVEIKTIIGQNSIATATGGTNTIKYLKRG